MPPSELQASNKTGPPATQITKESVRMRLCVALLAVLLPMGACATSPHGHDAMATGIFVVPDLPVTIFDRDGAPATYLDILDAASDADVVVIGESHGHEVGLAFAGEVFEDLLQSRPGTALSMEFYERDQQVALDDYLQGVTDAEAFARAAHRSEGNDPPGHRRMLEAARSAGAAVIAANAPRRYVTLARKEGFDRLRSLTPEQSRLFVIPETPPGGRYKDDFVELMSGMFADGSHGTPTPKDQIPAMVEATFRSQSVWDATMADSIARTVRTTRPVVHVVGRFHSDFEGGTIQLLRRQMPHLRIVRLSMIIAGDQAVTEIAKEDLGRADFVIYSGTLDDSSPSPSTSPTAREPAGESTPVSGS